MADQIDNGDGTTSELPTETKDEASWLKDLRRKAKDYDEAQTKLQRYEQRDAVREVEGLKGLTDKQIHALLATSGESTPDAWKQNAEDLGFYKPEPPVDSEAKAAHDRVANASQGSQSIPPPNTGNPYLEAKTAEDVMRIAEQNGSATTWGS